MFITVVLISCFNVVSSAQIFDSTYQHDYAWQVKQIDEFMERFNDDSDATIKKITPPGTLNRTLLIKSLFNISGRRWDLSLIQKFISAIEDPENPIFLHLADTNWCAILNCGVSWNKKQEQVLLTLQIIKQEDESLKWVITDASATFLARQYSQDTIAHNRQLAVPLPIDPTTSLNPLSHAVRFMNIENVSKDVMNVGNYFAAPNTIKSGELQTFITGILEKRLIVERPLSLKFIFFQVKGWIFEVEEYNRVSPNSGWLISKLVKKTE